tara:strand:- start:1282 stop:1512 length:231 start_codon:yes stop_codon:yes gene_type:complete
MLINNFHHVICRYLAIHNALRVNQNAGTMLADTQATGCTQFQFPPQFSFTQLIGKSLSHRTGATLLAGSLGIAFWS